MVLVIVCEVCIIILLMVYNVDVLDWIVNDESLESLFKDENFVFF